MERKKIQLGILILFVIGILIGSFFYLNNLKNSSLYDIEYKVEISNNNESQYSILVPIPEGMEVSNYEKKKVGTFNSSVESLRLNGVEKPFLNITSNEEILLIYKTKLTKDEYIDIDTSLKWAYDEENQTAVIFSYTSGSLDLKVRYLHPNKSAHYIEGKVDKKGWNNLLYQKTSP